ncbi:transposase [Streptococcus equinus]|nr:transposase [Streptococcus equinus]
MEDVDLSNLLTYQVKNEIHNLLQRANIKLTSYLSDVFSKTGQALLTLFINGEAIDSESVASCIHRRIKASPEELVEAMNGKLSLEDRFLISQSLEEYQMYQNLIETLESEIKDYIKKEFP